MKKDLCKILFIIFATFFSFTNLLAADQNELMGKDCKDTTETPGKDDLDIKYMGNPSLGYGKQATAAQQPFKAIVFHWPGASSCNLDAAVNYGLTVDGSRGGQFGYTFYIGTDGKIAQGAPMNKRTNHVSGSSRRAGAPPASNTYAMGVTLVCSERNVSPAQKEAAVKLGLAIQQAYGIPSSNIYGHGDIQTNRQPNEGIVAKNALKAANGEAKKTKIFYTLKGGKRVLCEVDGPVPQNCTGSYCNNVQGQTPPPGSYYPQNAFAQPPGSKYLSDGNDWRYPFQQPDSKGNLQYQPTPAPAKPLPNTNPYLPKTEQPNPFLPQKATPTPVKPAVDLINPFMPTTEKATKTASTTKTTPLKKTSAVDLINVFSGNSSSPENPSPSNNDGIDYDFLFNNSSSELPKRCTMPTLQQNIDKYNSRVNFYDSNYGNYYGPWQNVRQQSLGIGNAMAKLLAKNISDAWLEISDCPGVSVGEKI